MSSPASKQPFRPSLLDRLARNPAARPRGTAQELAELRQSVALDLQRLLNTRTSWIAAGPQRRQLSKSLFTYGLPDFSGLAWGDYDARNRLQQVVQATIEFHEPRLRGVLVTIPKDAGQDAIRTLRFRIEAELCVEPILEPVAFDAVQEPAKAQFLVKRVSV